MIQGDCCLRQEQTHRHRAHSGGCHGEGVPWGGGAMAGESGVSRCKLLLIGRVQGKVYWTPQEAIFN